MKKKLFNLLTLVSVMLMGGANSAGAQTDVTVGVIRPIDGTAMGEITPDPTTGDITAQWVLGELTKVGNNKALKYVKGGSAITLDKTTPIWGSNDEVTNYEEEKYVGTKITIADGKQFNVSEIHALLASDNAFNWKIVIENENGTELFSNTEQTTTAGSTKSGSDTYEKTSFGEEAQAKLSGLKGIIYLKVYFYHPAGNMTKYLSPLTLQLKGTLEEAAVATQCEEPGGKWGHFDYETLTYPLTLSTTDGSSVLYSTDGETFNAYTEPINVAAGKTITAKSVDETGTLAESTVVEFTAADAPACPTPEYVLSTYNSNTKEWTLTFSHSVSSAAIYVKVDNNAEAAYTEPLALAGGEKVTAYATLEGTPNSETVTVNVAAAPKVIGTENTTEERGYSYRLEAGYGGSSSNSKIAGVKLNNASVDGFNLLVNETFIITDMNVTIAPNGGKDCVINGVYVDVEPEDIATAEPVMTDINMPVGDGITFDLKGINAKKNVFFAVTYGDGTSYKQANMLAKINYQFESYKAPYTLTTEDTDFYSLYLDYAATIPAGVTAYTGVLNAEETTLTATPVEGNVLPAGCAVLVKSDAAGEFTFEEAETEAPAIETSLKGVTVDTDVTALAENGKTVLTLGRLDGVSGFRNPAGTQIKANKAYLLVNSVSAAKGIKIVEGGNTTGITEVNAGNAADNAPAYNVAGQRVTEAAKGLIIKNGKKFMNK